MYSFMYSIYRKLLNWLGLWRPREGIWYESKTFRRHFVDVECSIDGKEWHRCKFRLVNGVYEVQITKYEFEKHPVDPDPPIITYEELKRRYGNLIRKDIVFKIPKEYVDVKKRKASGVAVIYPEKRSILIKGIKYTLLVKDPSKIIYLQK